MTAHSFEEDIFGEGYVSPRTQQKKPKNDLINTWKHIYLKVYEVEFDRMSDPSLFVACTDLARFCKTHNLDIEEYVTWAMSSFDVFSPRRITTEKFLSAFLSSRVPVDASGGYFIIETGEVVPMVFQENGQVALELPSDGQVFVDGKLVHAKRV
jgi:hypothetical protein